MNGVQQQNKFSADKTLIIKGVATCLLLWHHLYYENPDRSLTYIIAYYGKVCVAIFLILSGYGLVKSFNKYSSSFKFVVEKIEKLYLNYWLIWVIFVPIGIIFFDRSLASVYKVNIVIKLIINLLGIQTTVFGFYGYNPTWWFMGLIIVFYFLFPLLYKAIIKYSKLTLLLSFIFMILPIWYKIPLIGSVLGNYIIWIFPFILGIYAAHTNIFERLSNIKFNKFGKLVLYFSLLMIFMIIRVYGIGIINIKADGIIGFMICIVTFEYISNIKYLNSSLKFIGKHSSNIFLFHTFIYYLYFKKFIYSFRYNILIFIVLLCICLIISICIEIAKGKIFRIYEKKHLLTEMN